MNGVIGVDSATAVDEFLFTKVSSTLGAEPRFWGRYLGGTYGIIPTEISFLRSLPDSERPRLLPIYSETTTHPSKLKGIKADGLADATEAINLAAQEFLSLPTDHTVALYADIEENYEVSSGWLTGWIQGITIGGFVPGVYLAPGGPVSEGFCDLGPLERKNLVLWSSQKSVDGSNPINQHCCQLEYVSALPTGAIHLEKIRCGDEQFEPAIWQCVVECSTPTYDVNIATQSAYDLMFKVC